MAVTASASKRRRIHVSKNKKKSWNKYSDIKDIDDFLEEKRLEERIGGAPRNKADDELFFIETKESAPQEICKNKKYKPLKCFLSLTAYSKVAIPVPENSGVIGKRQKKRSSKVLDKKLKNKPTGNLYVPPKGKETRASRGFYDLWKEDENDVQENKPKISCHRYQRPSLLPSVEIPHAGASYNPTYIDHQELLLKAVLVEQKKEKEEQHLKRVLTDMFPTKDQAPTQETWLAEMSQGLYEEEGDVDDQNNEDQLLLEITNPAVRAEDRKTKVQKNKKRRIQMKERQKKLLKMEMNRVHEVYRLRNIKVEIKEKEKISKEKRDEKDKKEMEKMYTPHTLSRNKYEPQDLEVNLSEELPGCMRELKVEGNLLDDRYKSLQRRNMLEPRVKQSRKRKYKLKVQVKRSHRDFK